MAALELAINGKTWRFARAKSGPLDANFQNASSPAVSAADV